MIRVKVLTLGEKLLGYELSGHAEAAKEGEDLVCAGFSAIAQAGIAALSNPEGYTITKRKGYLLVKANSEPSSRDEIVLETIIAMLESLVESYSDYARLERK